MIEQLEIERKFLIDLTKIDQLEKYDSVDIQQGYLLKGNNGSARVRIEKYYKSGKYSYTDAYVMIKQKVSSHTNKELTFPISEKEAQILLANNCQMPTISKTRYLIYSENRKWEIDVFHGHKQGLVLAELEVKDINENIIIPNWIKEEVTGQSEYYNVNM